MTRTTRPRGFAPWQPQAKARDLVAQINGVLHEYSNFLPLTIRQVFYRLVGNHGFDKTEAAYARLCETFNRARRAGYIPFDAIRDDGITRLEPRKWAGVSGFKDTVAEEAQRFRLDRQAGQQSRLYAMCEAGGMAPMLARAADAYGVPVLSSGGFDSLTAKHDLAQEIAASNVPCEVLHIGDYDPSGVHLFTALAEDIGAMVAGLGGSRVRFSRLAVTMDQIDNLDLPTAPPKKTDNRAFGDTRTVQAEAIPPDDLSDILKRAIEARQDAGIRNTVLVNEMAARDDLQRWLGGAA